KNNILVKPIDSSKMYDGLSLSSSSVELILGILPDGHVIEVMTNGGQLEVGSSLNDIISISVFKGNVDKTINYEILTESGTLSVTKRPITVKPVFVSKVYDDLPLTSDLTEVVSPIGLVDQHIITSTT